MKKTLEAALVLAALALGVYVARHALARREPGPPARPAAGPGADVESSDARPAGASGGRGVESLPMLRLSRPPAKPARAVSVPPPTPPTP